MQSRPGGKRTGQRQAYRRPSPPPPLPAWAGGGALPALSFFSRRIKESQAVQTGLGGGGVPPIHPSCSRQAKGSRLRAPPPRPRSLPLSIGAAEDRRGERSSTATAPGAATQAGAAATLTGTHGSSSSWFLASSRLPAALPPPTLSVDATGVYSRERVLGGEPSQDTWAGLTGNLKQTGFKWKPEGVGILQH